MPPGAYAKPPIVEAIVEFRFRDILSTADRRRLDGLFQKSHPQLERRVIHEIEMTNGGTRIKSSDDGTFVRRTSDAIDAVVVTQSAVGFTRSPPYDGWGDFRDRCMRGWEKVVNALGRRVMGRLGVRFQNRIDVPGSGALVQDVIRLSATPVEELGGRVIGINEHLVVALPDRLKANVMISSAEGALIDHASFMLDLDVYDDDWTLPKDDAIAQRLDELRDVKNQLFEAYITEHARTLFDSV